MIKTPSIGSLGITVDRKSRRVKALYKEVFSSFQQIQTCLIWGINEHLEAKEFLCSQTVRFTARVIVVKDLLGHIGTFRLPGGIIVSEEARIQTAAGLDIVYIGGNSQDRIDDQMLEDEKKLLKAHSGQGIHLNGCPATDFGVTFERLYHPVLDRDVSRLIEMYSLCFTSYPVSLGSELIQIAAKSSIFSIARNREGEIIASAVGESLKLGPVTLLEVSEFASHPGQRIKGVASSCAKRVIEYGKMYLPCPVVAFWEVRMLDRAIASSCRVGLTKYGGLLHRHCMIGSTDQFTSIPQSAFGSLAVFYAP